jgi:hypothetical protein
MPDTSVMTTTGSLAPAAKPADERPIANLRIRLWGVQGSCPLFPEAYEVDEYKRMLHQDLLKRVLNDLQRHSQNGSGCTVEDLLHGPINDANLAAYQQRLGEDYLPVYGGDTTCASIETADGNILVIDGGSGIRNCSKFFTGSGRWPQDRPRQVYIIGTHEHLDHRSGLPFCQFCFVRPPFTLHVYGSFQFLRALDERYGVFSRQISSSAHLDDPIDYRVMAATFRGYEMRNKQAPVPEVAPPWEVRDVNEPVRIGNTSITAFDVYHGSCRCLAYKIQHGPASFVFCTDHELRHGADPADKRQAQSHAADARLVDACRGVDAAYFDAQYFRDEYDGKKGIGVTMPVSRVDWGHGCMEDVVARVKLCRIKRAYIGHHDPERTWVARLGVDRWLEEQFAGLPYKVALAKSEDMLDL